MSLFACFELRNAASEISECMNHAALVEVR